MPERMTPLEPARLAFAEDGTPFSEAYGDVYHSAAGGLAQARWVFVAGNRLPQRWQQRESFTIVETGFGIGLNFLATWLAWRTDPQRCGRLHFVSTELHPFAVFDLARLHFQWPEVAELSAHLRRHWPALTPGFHRLNLDGGAVTLTLLFGDTATLLPQLDCAADAFYLDGFSPARNPSMWSEGVIAELGRLASNGASLATWSVSAPVRERLGAAGFSCTRDAGFASKREMLVGRFEGRRAPTAGPASRDALVIGAGLAGTAIANRLAERGWTITIIDAAESAAQGASGNHAGVLRPLPSLDDNRLARLTRAGSLYGVHHLDRLGERGFAVKWDPCGVLHVARDSTQQAKMRATVEAHRYPTDFLRIVDAAEAARIAGWPVAFGGWWFPRGGWIQPPSLCAANIEAESGRIACRFDRSLARLIQDDGQWVALDPDGHEIARAHVAILANGTGITDLEQASMLPVRSARGQVAHLPAMPDSAPRVVVCRLGYVSPAIDGIRCAGATFSVDDDESALRLADHHENLAKLDFMLPGYAGNLRDLPMRGRVGFRPASPDRLPIVGSVPIAGSVDRNTALDAIPRHSNLHAVSGFGARGLVWAALVAEYLASRLDREPLPVERDLADAMDPARYLLRAPKRGRTREN